MDKEVIKTQSMARSITEGDKKFKGYTLEEIRYQRALVAMQAEFCKTKIFKSVSNIQKTNPLSPTSAATSLPGKLGAVALKLVNGLNYLDYAVLGFSLFNGMRKVYSFFKKPKK